MRRLVIDLARYFYQSLLTIVCLGGERLVHFQAPAIPADANRVLILHAGGDKIGDAILFSPIPSLVKQRFPSAVVDLLVRPQVADVYRHNPSVDHLILWEEANRRPYLAHDVTSFLLFRQFRPARYDMAVLLEDSFQMSAAVFLSGIPIRAGFNTDGRGFPLNLRVPLPRPWRRTKKDREYYLDGARVLGIEVGEEDKGTRLYPGVEADRFAEELFRTDWSGRQVITIHPGAGWIDRCWPDDRMAELADRLIESNGVAIVFVGGRLEVEKVERIQALMRNEATNLTGRLSLLQMAAVIKRSTAFVGNDGGPAQVPGAVDTCQVTLFGPAEPEFWEPYNGRLGISIFHKVECCPCEQNFYRTDARCRRGDPVCMRAIAIDEVVAAVGKILSAEKLESQGEERGTEGIGASELSS